MIWSEMLYNKCDQSFTDRLQQEPETLDEYDEVKEVIDELNKASLFIFNRD